MNLERAIFFSLALTAVNWALPADSPKLPAHTEEIKIEFSTPTCQPEFIRPTKNRQINSGFGNRPDPLFPNETNFHTGVDFDGALGDPVTSSSCGTVVFAGKETDPTQYEWGYGNRIEVKVSPDLYVVYAHLDKIHVRAGDQLKSKQLIGEVGSTGNSTGPHLHWEVRKGSNSYQNAVNPLPYLKRSATPH